MHIEGADFEEVAGIPGNSPVIVRKHDAKWPVARQARITDLLERIYPAVNRADHTLTLHRPRCTGSSRRSTASRHCNRYAFAGKLEEGWRVSGTLRALMTESSENAERWQSPVECT